MSDNLFSSCDNISITDSLFDDKSLTFFTQDEQLGLKVQMIKSCISQKCGFLSRCMHLGVSRNGFVNHSLRRQFWCHILRRRVELDGTLDDMFSSVGVSSFEDDYGEGAQHPDEAQVVLDVKRSFGFITDEVQKSKLRSILQATIIRFLRKYPELRYYQGYHDVVSVFVMVFQVTLDAEPCFSLLSNLDDHLTTSVSSSVSDTTVLPEDNDLQFNPTDAMFAAVEVFSLLYLRDFMMTSLDFTIDHLKIIPHLIQTMDPLLYEQLQWNKVDPFFALSSILTIFSHELKPDYNELSPLYEIFDMVITSGSMLVPLVIYTQLIIEHKEQLLESCETQADLFDNITDLLHGVIQQVLRLPHTTEQWHRVLERSRDFLDSHIFVSSSDELNSYFWINPYSVLKTVPANDDQYTLEEIQNIVQQEIKANEQRRAVTVSTSTYAKTPTNVWWPYELFAKSGPVWKWPIYIGILALLLKAYTQNQPSLTPIALWHAVTSAASMTANQAMSMSTSFRFTGVGAPTLFLDPVKSLFQTHIS
ncbi:GTPase-activating protein GYP8 Ecym_1498 [Eremothecium cymbalariae DBVPG|uniref:Rab-GAP TBC domain-containing protein n=1 Tax=Eremothecium cymbalariae (strain CBS 270.75 / DBVPG 7215 / KCTC 17166 / NRRL Y-17582) TaxID=931890 RepID=G8JMQ7_ERECY|nr:hypothetical protein Ecym_1498 [Eremothecium cymbalariae DBVPG\